MTKTILISTLLVTKICTAQTKNFTYGNQVWYGYYPQIKLSNHWGVWNDWEMHSKENFVEGVSQIVFRLGATY